MRGSTLALAATMAVVCGQAEAAVYTFTPTAIGQSPEPFSYTTQDATFTIGISDAAVQSGSFTYNYQYTYPSSADPSRTTAGFVATGNVQDLLFYKGRRESFVSGGGPGGTSSDLFTVSLQFSPSGQVSAGRLLSSTDSYGIDISGNGGLFNGSFYIGNLRSDTVVGSFVSASNVPEPTTIALLGISLSCVVLRRRYGGTMSTGA